MKKIGRGWQYTTYDKGNGRVLKKYNTRFQSYSIMMKQNFPFWSYPIWKLSKYYNGCKNTALSSIQKIKKTKMNLSIFGNPTILNELDYEQDKVVPLHIYFKKINNIEGKLIIDKFVKFNKMLLENKLIDKSFLIGKNYGINNDGEIVLIDIGELYSSEESIKKQIQKRPWEHPYVTSTIPDKELREYFILQMNNNFK